MQEGVGRRNIEDWVQDGVRRVRSTSLGELKSSSSSETFSAARRLVLDSVLGRVSNSQAAVVRRKAVHQVKTPPEAKFSIDLFNFQLTTLGDPGPFLALVGISLASGLAEARRLRSH